MKDFTPEQEIDGDFLHSPMPAPVSMEFLAEHSHMRFVNRELSWLAFNWRVLEEGQNPRVPLLERVRMLSISGSNLDEFYTVRVAGLRELVKEGIQSPAADGLIPSEQLELIDIDARRLLKAQQETWSSLQVELEDNGIDIVQRDELTAEDREFLSTLFQTEIFPILSPLAVDPAHPFPFIANGGITIALRLSRIKDGQTLRALLPVPAQIDRFIELPNTRPEASRLIMLDEIFMEFVHELFPGYKLNRSCIFQVLRDSDLEIEDEAEDLVREFETALKRRRRGEVVRLQLSANAPSDLKNMILSELNVSEREVIELEGLIGISDLSKLVLPDRFDLLYEPFIPRVPERVQDFDGDVFAAIRQKDMLLHHPYESFDIVVRFLRQAALDPDVVAIKQTLYRTSNESPIVEALCTAAEEGKSVTAVVELKARFDEAANIRQSRRLERAGVQVVYGFIDLKTHAKISAVVRREDDKMVTYTHFGTGNYHPITANFYTDLSLFTCSKSLGLAAAKVFNYISGYAEPVALKKLFVAPLNLKSELVRRIQAEAEIAREGGKGHIWAKMNSLVEPDVIDALYEASSVGVRIELVVRGICGLRPGVIGLSENIRVKSVVGRFLEHSRIVCFGNGAKLPSKHAKVFMSSADWMGRNLNRRVESLVQITNRTVHAQIMSQIMAANLADQANSWVMQPDGRYLRHNKSEDGQLFSCHKFFMENPSLSGRGKVGAKDVPLLTHSDDNPQAPQT